MWAINLFWWTFLGGGEGETNFVFFFSTIIRKFYENLDFKVKNWLVLQILSKNIQIIVITEKKRNWWMYQSLFFAWMEYVGIDKIWFQKKRYIHHPWNKYSKLNISQIMDEKKLIQTKSAVEEGWGIQRHPSR